jgi:hyperosmotically inducible periplasmic protein
MSAGPERPLRGLSPRFSPTTHYVQRPLKAAARPNPNPLETIMNTTFGKLALASAITFALLAASGAHAGPVGKELTEARQETQIWTTYALSPHLRATDLSVKVTDGTATLTGEVPQDVNRQLAHEIALGVGGISKVDNRIVVKDDFVPAPRATRGYGDIVDDASITAAVKSKLLWSRHTDGLDIHVTTLAGKVRLEGNADSAESKALAGRLASNTQGVNGVDNALVIAARKPAAAKDAPAVATGVRQDITDSWITTKVKSTYMYSSNITSSDISVDTANGIVTLTGKVDSGAERALAIEMAQNIRGVSSVVSSGLVL